MDAKECRRANLPTLPPNFRNMTLAEDAVDAMEILSML